MVLRIGTRGSKLAIAQSEWVKERIEAKHTGVDVELVTIKTTGDKILDSPLSQVGGKGLFVKEIEEALMERRVDLAVHSMKDVPADLPEGLMLSIFPEREERNDAFISIDYPSIEELPEGAVVGTSSLRRSAQLLYLRPDLKIKALRGNVDTRLKKLESGEVDCIILAAAGLKRLGMGERITRIIPYDTILPAIGQGALGLEVRREDNNTRDMVAFLNHEPTGVCVNAERSFLKELEGGCQVPIGAVGLVRGGSIHLEGLVAELDGSRLVKDKASGKREQAKQIGVKLARELKKQGAGEILERIYKSSSRK